MLKYLNEKFSNKEINNNNDKNNLVIEIKDDNSIDDNTDAESNIKPAKFKYIHILKNYRYCIQSYIIKNVDKDSGIVIYCENKNCKAFCHLTASKVYAKGTHNHKGTSKSFFNSKYPILVPSSDHSPKRENKSINPFNDVYFFKPRFVKFLIDASV